MQSDGSSAARPRVLLLFSGGIDSTMAAVILAARRASDSYALSILFPGQPEAEVAIARTLSTRLCFATFLEVTLQLHAPLLPGDGPESYRGWIPYRNLVFWSIAAHTAARVGATLVAAGHERSDADDFSDASNAFFRRSSSAFFNTPAPPRRIPPQALSCRCSRCQMQSSIFWPRPISDSWIARGAAGTITRHPAPHASHAGDGVNTWHTSAQGTQ